MQLAPAIQRFATFLRAERNLAPRTAQAYRYDLERMADYFADPARAIADATAVTAFDLKDYLAHLKDEHRHKPATLGRVISSMRAFFSYLADAEGLSPNPAAGLHTPKKGKKLPIYLTPGEASRTLARRTDDEDHALRDRTLLAVLIMTGMRLSELVGLDVADIDLASHTAKVLGKGRKERLVPLNRIALDALRQWLDGRPAPAAGCPALFLDRRGNRISPRTVQHLVKKTAKALGLDPRLSPHKLRHTFATALYAAETDLKDIQELLGHANIASTSIYTHTNVDRVRAAVEKLVSGE